MTIENKENGFLVRFENEDDYETSTEILHIIGNHMDDFTEKYYGILSKIVDVNDDMEMLLSMDDTCTFLACMMHCAAVSAKYAELVKSYEELRETQDDYIQTINEINEKQREKIEMWKTEYQKLGMAFQTQNFIMDALMKKSGFVKMPIVDPLTS